MGMALGAVWALALYGNLIYTVIYVCDHLLSQASPNPHFAPTPDLCRRFSQEARVHIALNEWQALRVAGPTSSPSRGRSRNTLLTVPCGLNTLFTSSSVTDTCRQSQCTIGGGTY